jgi:hypothetical protein
MRVYLDDERATPPGWVRVFWPDEAIALLETGQVDELSLDHDLGDDQRGTGCDVVLRVEEAVALRGNAGDSGKPALKTDRGAEADARKIVASASASA